MNKLYSQITSLIVILGLGTAWVFNVINETSFGTISVALLSAIYALYQKYEKNEVIKTNLKLNEKLKEISSKLLNISVSKDLILDKYEKLQKSLLSLESTVVETPFKETPAPKKTRKK